MYKVSPERERSPYRLQTAQDRPSKSPSRVYTEADRPRTPIESGNRSRDNSANRAKTGNYFFQPYSSPYVNGRKNDNFVHPSLASNPLFYDHNYGYKNDLPNDRLLTPVKHDKYRREDADHDTSYRGDRTPPRSPMQGNRRDTSEDNPLRNQSYSMKRIVTEENPRNALNRSVDIALRDREEVGPVRKNSAISQYDDFSRNKSSNNLGRNERFTTSPDNVREGGRLGGSNTGNRKQSDNQSMRDDMSEASTVMSTLSTTGYLCPKCMNKHMAGNKRAMCGFERELEKDQEARITNMHRKYFEEQEAKQKLEKAKRLEDTKEMKRILDEKHERRFEERRSPPKERDTSLHKVFDRQEEMKQKQMMLKQVFGTHIKNQIKAKEEEREKEKQANAQIHGTSLPIPGGYHNKYLDDPATVRAVIKDQVEEKFFNQMRERENEKRMAQDMHEQAMQQQQEEEQRRKMKDWAQKKEMRDAFARATNEKNRKQKAAELDKSAERMRVDQGYDDYKRRQMEKEEQTRKQLMGFKQYLLAQQEKMSYKQKYDERKQQKEGTSFDPAKRTKKKYPCGECNDPYEKIHLTKMH